MTHGSPRAHDTGGEECSIPGFAELTPPCSHACGAHEPVREWVLALQRDDEDSIHRAWARIVAANPLPAVLGRICYADCERDCNRGALDGAVSIRELEGRVGDYALARGWALPPAPRPPGARSARIAVVGSGPCGLSAASRLARAGHRVTLWEAQRELGGLLGAASAGSACRAPCSTPRSTASRPSASTSGPVGRCAGLRTSWPTRTG